MPILDGLDEIPEQVRGLAISRINDGLQPGEQVVATCRTEPYRNAIRPEGGIEVTLRGAAAVRLHPLDAETIRSYLCDDAAGPLTRARWNPVLPLIGTEAPAGQALSTPLMVGMARAIYNPPPGDPTGAVRDPVELCGPALADSAAVENLLFDAFIPAAYRHDSAGRWNVQDAERWLVFLAHNLEHTTGGQDLAWWQMWKATPRVFMGLVVTFGVIGGLCGAFAGGLLSGATAALIVGLIGALVFGFVALLGPAQVPVRTVRLNVRGLGRVLRFGCVFPLWAALGFGLTGMTAGVIAGGLTHGLEIGLAAGVVGLLLGLFGAIMLGGVGGLAFAFVGVPRDLAEVMSPRAVLVRHLSSAPPCLRCGSTRDQASTR